MSVPRLVDIPTPLQEHILRNAINDKRLRRALSPFQVLSFGVIPIAQQGRTTVVACPPEINTRCFPVLKRVLNGPVHGIYFSRGILERYLQRVMERHGAPVNLPTFLAPDFLENEEVFDDLTREKVEEGLSGKNELSPADLLLLEVDYRSELTNLDWPEEPEGMRLGGIEIPFRIRDGRTEVYRQELLEPTAVMAIRKRITNVGANRSSRMEAVVASRMPVPLHPTEVQITGVSRSGNLSVHIYDHTMDIPFGTRKTIDCEYHYLSEGNRYHRRLTMTFRNFRLIPKTDAVYLAEERWGDEQDLNEWFDLNPGELGT